MLAEACKSVEAAMAKNPEGVYSEIKYDGERVQIHKHGSEFKWVFLDLWNYFKSNLCLNGCDISKKNDDENFVVF